MCLHSEATLNSFEKVASFNNGHCSIEVRVLITFFHHNHFPRCWCSSLCISFCICGSKGEGARDARPHLGVQLFSICAVLGKNWLNNSFSHPPLELALFGWLPHFGEILHPPLNSSFAFCGVPAAVGIRHMPAVCTCNATVVFKCC